MSVHKNQEGVYTIHLFDRYGRGIKRVEVVAMALTEAIELGKDKVTTEEEATSFLVKRNVYNSLDHY